VPAILIASGGRAMEKQVPDIDDTAFFRNFVRTAAAVSGATADGRDSATHGKNGSPPPRLRLIGLYLPSLAVLVGILYAWWNPAVQPEPFDPAPPLSLQWWISAPPDRGLASLNMVPVGTFGAFLPRPLAGSLRKSGVAFAEVSDAWVGADGRQAIVVSRPIGHEAAMWSTVDGAIWTPAKFQHDGLSPDCVPRILWAEAPNEFAIAGLRCPTTPHAAVGAKIDVGVLGSLLDRGAQIETDMHIQTAIYIPPQTLVLTSGVPPSAWRFISQQGGIRFPTTLLPDNGPIAIVQPAPSGQILMAGPTGLIRFSPFAPGDIGRPAEPSGAALRKAPGFGATDRPTSPPAPAAQAQTAQAPVASPSTVAIPITDPARPGAHPLIRVVRLSADGQSIVVAQAVAADNAALVSHDGGKSWQRLPYTDGIPPWVLYLGPLFLITAVVQAARLVLAVPVDRADPSIADEMASDRPITAADLDVLQFGPIARGLLLFIRNPNTEPPVTIAVTGPWGSGKSSLMQILRDLLAETEARPVWFNAWHHQKEEHLLAALLENIRRQAVPGIGTAAGLGFRWRLLRRRAVLRLSALVVATAIAATGLTAYLSLPGAARDYGKDWLLQTYQTVTKGGQEAADTTKAEADKPAHDGALAVGGAVAMVAALPSGLAIPVLVLMILLKLQPFPGAKPAELVGGKKRNEMGRLSFRYRFEGEFRETSEALRTRTNPGLVIFIDDLDRCRAEQVVELLEAVNFIVSSGPCFVVLGMDKAQVRRSIISTYRNSFEIPRQPGDPDIDAARVRFADRYLQKLINIEVPIPRLTETLTAELLTAGRPAPTPQVAPWRRLVDAATRNAPITAVLAVCLALGFVVFERLPTIHVPEPHPAADGTVKPVAGGPVAAGAGAPGGVPAANVPVYQSDADLLAAAPATPVPWGGVALIAAMLLVAGLYLRRQIALVEQQPIPDSPSFIKALQRWNEVIFIGADTPRAVKHFKNWLRYDAMCQRLAAAPIPEAHLVGLGAIDLTVSANRPDLTEAVLKGLPAVDPGVLQPLRAKIESAVAAAAADHGAVITTSVAAYLKFRRR
jgi:hypothetical protein